METPQKSQAANTFHLNIQATPWRERQPTQKLLQKGGINTSSTAQGGGGSFKDTQLPKLKL